MFDEPPYAERHVHWGCGRGQPSTRLSEPNGRAGGGWKRKADLTPCVSETSGGRSRIGGQSGEPLPAPSRIGGKGGRYRLRAGAGRTGLRICPVPRASGGFPFAGLPGRVSEGMPSGGRAKTLRTCLSGHRVLACGTRPEGSLTALIRMANDLSRERHRVTLKAALGDACGIRPEVR
jgi:hypothetical protein